MVVESRLGKEPPPKNVEVIKQDVFILGGRCAWALERILGIELPPVTAKSSEEDIEKICKESHEKRNAQFREETTKEILARVDKMTLEEKRNESSQKDATSVALHRLGKEKDLEMRRNVAKNPNTGVGTLEILAKDSDKEVRHFVIQNPHAGFSPDLLTKISKEDPDPVLREEARKVWKSITTDR